MVIAAMATCAVPWTTDVLGGRLVPTDGFASVIVTDNGHEIYGEGGRGWNLGGRALA